MSKKNNTINKKDNTKLVNILIIVGIFFLIGSLVLMFTKNDKNNHITEINFKEYQEIIKEDKYNIILFTSPTCSHCINYKPYVNYVADEYGLTVYDINLSDLEMDEYKKLHDSCSATKNEYDDKGNPVIPTPVTLIVRNGEEVASFLGEIGHSKLTKFLKNNNVIQ